MMNCPHFIEVKGKRYKINTNFKAAIKCNIIAEDENIGDFERALAVIYTLFGNEALDDVMKDYSLLNDFLKLAEKYLLCGEEKKQNKNNEKPDMDYIEDYFYIKTSIKSDYNGLDIDKEDLHWWEFYYLLNGLSNSELGNCCILNKIRNIRNADPQEIKDKKERDKLIEAKKNFELKKYKKENNLTKKQEESMNRLNEILKKRKE